MVGTERVLSSLCNAHSAGVVSIRDTWRRVHAA